MGAELAIPLRSRALQSGRRPLRVLMTGDTVGGVWQYALELSRALIARGARVTLATMGGLPDREQRGEAAAIPGLDLRTSRCKLLWMEAPWDDVRAAEDWLLSIAQEVQPDVVHLNDLGHGDLPWPAPVLTVGHSCVLSWWRAVHGQPAPEPQWTRYRRRVSAGLHASQLVVAPTQAMLSSLQEFYGPLRASRVIA
ncbi:MAG TPA: glycosyltransferase family 4 protein, partial [Rhodanobacteraceae bacterium]